MCCDVKSDCDILKVTVMFKVTLSKVPTRRRTTIFKLAGPCEILSHGQKILPCLLGAAMLMMSPPKKIVDLFETQLVYQARDSEKE